jgi:serine/threonine-protein kinase
MSRCASCGSESREPGRYCASCGAALEESPAPDSFATRTVAMATPRSAGRESPASVSRTSVSRASDARAKGRFSPGVLLGGRYRIIAMLGKGGMGEVYRADDLSLDQPVALKFLPEALAQNPQSLDRFRNEVRIARQVSHPNVCRVYDMGEMEGQYFLSMEYVDGEDLGSLLRRIGRLPADKALEIARKLCAGLAAAHEKGVLHRDLKPSNVMLDARGQVLLTDFGLAGLAGEIEGAEVRNGTPAYMAPEQLAGEEVTIKSDIYALGLVLYEIFTGKLPFESTTLAGLMRAQKESQPASPASLVRDLDPMVERVILRCLNPKPSLRPASALAVAAALRGGDPLAAALAAGETPSPEMVAAAGEGEGLALRVALPLLVFILAGTAVSYALGARARALAMLQPEFGPEVMAQKARDTVSALGVTGHAADEVWAFEWDVGLFDWFRDHTKPAPDWRAILSGDASALNFWYRRALTPMTGVEFHDDLLTPGVIDWGDPPPEESGMVRLKLDSRGRLLYFERVPEQKQTAPAAPAPVDWAPLFALAGFDFAKFKPAEPLWNSLASSDTRAAWTADSPRPIRVEAAALGGHPVFFSLVQPWLKPNRAAEDTSTNQTLVLALLSAVLVVICVSAAVLAHRNLKQQRGDRRGAFRLAVFIACVQLAVWLGRCHFTATFGTFAIFLIAMATSVFYGVVMWTVYIALEPYVRRRWPQTLISWSALLIGRTRDAVVGRDVLFGCAAGSGIAVFATVADAWSRRLPSWTPNLDQTAFIGGGRLALAQVLSSVPRNIREALFFFFLIFLLRALLRNQWLAAAAFSALFSLASLASSSPWLNVALSFVILFGFAALLLRYGLVSMVSASLFLNIVMNAPPIGQGPAWYAGSTFLVLGLAVALALWAFRISIGSRKLLDL